MEDRLTPIYPTTEGVQQGRLRMLVGQALHELGTAGVHEWLPPEILQTLNLPSLREALEYVHRPPVDAELDELEAGAHPTQRRLAPVRGLHDVRNHLPGPLHPYRGRRASGSLYREISRPLAGRARGVRAPVRWRVCRCSWRRPRPHQQPARAGCRPSPRGRRPRCSGRRCGSRRRPVGGWRAPRSRPRSLARGPGVRGCRAGAVPPGPAGSRPWPCPGCRRGWPRRRCRGARRAPPSSRRSTPRPWCRRSGTDLRGRAGTRGPGWPPYRRRAGRR